MRWVNKDAVFQPSEPWSVALFIHKFIRLHFLVFWCSHYTRNVIMGHAPLPSNCNCIYWTVYKLVNNSSAKYRAAIEYIVSWMRRTLRWLTYTRRSCFLQLCRAPWLETRPNVSAPNGFFERRVILHLLTVVAPHYDGCRRFWRV